MYQILEMAARHGNGIFEFGEVVGFDTARESYNDGTSQNYPTGLLVVKLNSTDDTVKLPYLVPSAGKSQFFGGVPEIGAVAMLANVTGDPRSASYIVIGFLPVPLNKMVAARKEMTRLTSGEVMMQGSANGLDDFWRSAFAKIDEYGRFIINSGDDDLQIVVGDMLSNEYTPQVAVLRDPLSNSTVVYKMKMHDNDTTVTRDGTLIHRWTRILQDIGGDWLSVLKGRFIVTSGQQIRLAVQGEDANYIEIDPQSGVTLKAVTKFTVETGGKIDISCSDALSLSCFLDMVFMANGNMQLKAARDLLAIAANIKLTASQGNIVLTNGAAGAVLLGSDVAAQSVVRGNDFLTAMAATGSMLDSLGMPITKPFLVNTAPYLVTTVKVP